jgi:Family of unknown function (DUF6884)
LNPDAIFVLSAKYGLVGLKQEVEPYDLTLNRMAVREVKQWADRVVDQLGDVSDLRRDRIVLLAEERYRKYLLPHISHYEVPLRGLVHDQGTFSVIDECS